MLYFILLYKSLKYQESVYLFYIFFAITAVRWVARAGYISVSKDKNIMIGETFMHLKG